MDRGFDRMQRASKKSSAFEVLSLPMEGPIMLRVAGVGQSSLRI